MHFGSFKNFQRATFLMDNKSQTRHEIEESSVERDLGVMTNSKLKFFVQEATLFAAEPIISKRLSVVSI